MGAKAFVHCDCRRLPPYGPRAEQPTLIGIVVHESHMLPVEHDAEILGQRFSELH